MSEPQAAAQSVDKDTWWNQATLRPSGRERILAPRELRALLAEGRRRGFDQDKQWWGRRSAWTFERILSVDPEDVEANAGTGRATLQSIRGFEALWTAMLETRTPNDVITELLDRYNVWVLDGQPIFLTREELLVERGRLREAATHLDKMEQDSEYASLQRALRQTKTSFHSDYPFIHVKAGPFVVFYAARDLQIDPEADADAEANRVATRAEYYRRRLLQWTGVYEELLKDIRTSYPRLWKRFGADSNTVFHQWVFGERAWYVDFMARVHKEDVERPYRVGFYHGATGWAYLFEPGEEGVPRSKAVLPETAAYLAAVQLMRRWARDAKDPTVNHLDRSRAYWLKEGWPAYLAARRAKSEIGRIASSALSSEWNFPSLQEVVERRSWIDRRAYLRPGGEGSEMRPPEDGGFSDLAWLLVKQLNTQPRRAAFEKFLVTQIDGSRRGLDWFEECFNVKTTAEWARLQRAVYAQID